MHSELMNEKESLALGVVESFRQGFAETAAKHRNYINENGNIQDYKRKYHAIL